MRICFLRGWLMLFGALTFIASASAQIPLDFTRGISVKAGDSINISAQAYSPRPKTFWRSLAKAIVPGVVFNRPTTQPKSALGEQRSSTVIFGAGVTVAPGAISLGNRHQPKPSIKLRLYDADTRLLSTQTYKASKASRQDWENLTINLKVEQDGFIDLLVDRGTGELVINSIDYKPQDSTAAGSWGNSRTTSSDDVPRQPGDSIDQPKTDDACIDCTQEPTPPPPPPLPPLGGGPTLLPPGYDPGSGGGGGAPPSDEPPGPNTDRECAKCKSHADNEKKAKMRKATYELSSNLTLWCAVGAGSAAIVTAEAIAIINVVPEVGQAATLIAALFAAFLEYGDCVATHILDYRAVAAEVENNYYKDIRDCNERWGCK